MAEQRVSDKRLAELLDSHAQAWIDNWDDGELVVWDADSELQEFKDLAALLRELAERRVKDAQRCETCEFSSDGFFTGNLRYCVELCIPVATTFGCTKHHQRPSEEE